MEADPSANDEQMSEEEQSAGELQSIVWGWHAFFDRLSHFLLSVDLRAGVANKKYVVYAMERLETCLLNVRFLKERLVTFRGEEDVELSADELRVVQMYEDQVGQLLTCLEEVHHECQEYADRLERESPQLRLESAQGYRAPLVRYSRPHRGRPRFDIGQHQLEYLSGLGFSWADVARLLGVSRMTVYRRRQELGMTGDQLTPLSDDQLKQELAAIRRDHPQYGETMAYGHLRSMGYRVTHSQLRQAIRTNDPINTALRWPGGLTSRQPYSVPGPNSLWHIEYGHSVLLTAHIYNVDGHHKLVRWRLVTHCGIDGYSRAVVYLRCSSNNRSDTVMQLFTEATDQFGVPSRVRSDQGGENIMVAQYMLATRGLHRGSMLVGSSVHNQRIERLWRDLHRCVTILYYRLFYHLESEGVLNALNEHHLFALHFVFKPRINRALEAFKEGWNHHPIRTERGLSPHQLFVAGTLRLRNSGLIALDFFDDIDEDYGLDEDGLMSESDCGVEIPDVRFSLTAQHMSMLLDRVDPLAASDSFGMDLYRQTLEFIADIVGSNPNVYSLH